MFAQCGQLCKNLRVMDASIIYVDVSVKVCLWGYEHIRKHKRISGWERENGVYEKCQCVSVWKYKCEYVFMCGSMNVPVCHVLANNIEWEGERIRAIITTMNMSSFLVWKVSLSQRSKYDCVYKSNWVWLWVCRSTEGYQNNLGCWETPKEVSFLLESHVSCYRQVT